MELTTENTAIVLDSTSDFLDAAALYPNMRVVPLYVRFGDESLRDGIDITPESFYRRLAEAPELPTTSQPTPQDFVAVYEELAGYDRVWSIHLSAKLSGTYQSAALAMDELGGDAVRLVDTETASCACALLALAIQRRLERGTTDAEVAALVDRFKGRNGVVFTVDTLEYLQKGGRIGRASALLGSVLSIKPILGVEDGVVTTVDKKRTSAKARARLLEIIADYDAEEVAVLHTGVPDLQTYREQVAQACGRPVEELEVGLAGPVAGSHVGPGMVGASLILTG